MIRTDGSLEDRTRPDLIGAFSGGIFGYCSLLCG
jgi:hypothetical protein